MSGSVANILQEMAPSICNTSFFKNTFCQNVSAPYKAVILGSGSFNSLIFFYSLTVTQTHKVMVLFDISFVHPVNIGNFMSFLCVEKENSQPHKSISAADSHEMTKAMEW